MELSTLHVCLMMGVGLVVANPLKSVPVKPVSLEACEWLVKNNYDRIKCEEVKDEELMESYLKIPLFKFQQHRKIELTGLLDETTIEEMNEPHCGLPEITVDRNSERIKRQIDMTGNPLKKLWGGPNFFMPLTLSMFNTWYKIDRISTSKQKEIVWQASQIWAAATSSLSFKWAREGKKGNIEIIFAYIDGAHGAIGKAGDPAPDEKEQSTWLRIDDAELWVATWSGAHLETEYSLLWAMVHEMGHNLGLGHSNNSNDIMYSKIQKTPEKLNIGDIQAIQNLYGGKNFVPPSPTIRSTTRQPESIVPVNLQPAVLPSRRFFSGFPSDLRPQSVNNHRGFIQVPGHETAAQRFLNRIKMGRNRRERKKNKLRSRSKSTPKIKENRKKKSKKLKKRKSSGK